MEFLRRGRSSPSESYRDEMDHQSLAAPSIHSQMQSAPRSRSRRLPELRPSLSTRRRPNNGMQRLDDEASEAPKTSRFNLGLSRLPGTRLHLPYLTRTWTHGSNGPNSRPTSIQQSLDRVDEASQGRFLTQAARLPPSSVMMPTPPDQVSLSGSIGRRRMFTRPHPTEMYETQMAQERRRPRSRCSLGGQQPNHDERHPKRFLFCFPYPSSRRTRSLVIRSIVSGSFLTLLLSAYLALSLTQSIRSSEFSVLLILVILLVTIFFCYGLIRLSMIVLRPRIDDELESPMPPNLAPDGYSVPRQPIRVVLARDEEEQGEVSEAVFAKPPAYGLWRESVRVDPNLIYWQRNPNAASNIGPSTLRESISGPRPPSYASDDGVSYIIDARPRSVAPTMTEITMPLHPSEVGRIR